MNIKHLTGRIRHFLTTEIWQLEKRELSALRMFAVRQVRIGYLIIKDLFSGSLHVRSATLTYRTLLSIIPFLALMFVIAKVMGLQHSLLTDLIPTVNQVQEESLAKVVVYIEQTNVKALGIVGLVFLLWMSLNLLLEISDAFNEIWGVRRQRNFMVRIGISLVIIIFIPFFLISATMVNAFLASNVEAVPLLQGPYRIAMVLVQYLVTGLAFGVLYTLVPNTRVRFVPAFFSGLAAGIVWHITQWIFIEFQVGVSRYNAIYGTFASLPLFLMWIYTSWFIILTGCEFAFATQNERQYAEEKFAAGASFKFLEHLGLGIFLLIFRRRAGGRSSCTAEQIGRFFTAPIRVVQDLLYKMEKAGLVVRRQVKKRMLVFEPSEAAAGACPLDVVNALREDGTDMPLECEDKNVILKKVTNLDGIRNRLLRDSEYNRPFSELVKAD